MGQYKEVWNSYIDWRIMHMVRDARAMGTDQVRAVIKRGRKSTATTTPIPGATRGTRR